MNIDDEATHLEKVARSLEGLAVIERKKTKYRRTAHDARACAMESTAGTLWACVDSLREIRDYLEEGQDLPGVTLGE